MTTREQYDDLVRLYNGPTLGNVLVGKVDAELLERLYSRLLRCKHLCSGRPPKCHVCRPLGPSSVRKVHYILRAAFARAGRLRGSLVRRGSRDTSRRVRADAKAGTRPNGRPRSHCWTGQPYAEVVAAAGRWMHRKPRCDVAESASCGIRAAGR